MPLYGYTISRPPIILTPMHIISPYDMHFHLIPGNPGAAEFYSEFKLMLSHERHIPFNHIHIAHHPGHSVTTIHEMALGLEALVAYHVEQMVGMYGVGERVDSGQVHLMGHSVGAYIALRVANALHHTHPQIFKRLKLHLICPTIIRMRDTPEGKRMVQWKHMALATASHVMSWVPLAIAYMSVPHHAMGSIWHKQVVDSTLMLWADEREMVQMMPVVANEVWERTRALCSPTDDWTPDFVRAEIRDQMETNGSEYAEMDVAHAFVMCREDTMEVVRWVGGGV
jgi:pimeloyl-ACP methyl ester carboxylesterase